MGVSGECENTGKGGFRIGSRCVRERAAVRGGTMLTVQPVEWIHSARAPESIKRLAHSCLSHR